LKTLGGRHVGQSNFFGETTGETRIDAQKSVHFFLIACKNNDHLVHELLVGHEADELINGFLRKMPVTEPVRFVHKKHFAQGLLEELLRLWASVTHVLPYEVGGGTLDKVRRRKKSHVIIHLTELPRNGCFSGT
jgi:hypothetical protein